MAVEHTSSTISTRASTRLRSTIPSVSDFAPQNATTDDLDSDPDPFTGLVAVDVNDAYAENVDAGYYFNTNPIAVDDDYATHKNTGITGNVTDNDGDADGDPLTAALATGPAYGTLTLNSDGSFSYSPNTDFVGTDTFTYTVDDGHGGTGGATVTITVADTPPPVGVDDSYSIPAGTLYVPAAGVLANDTNPNGGPLTAIFDSGPMHGTLT